MPEGVWPDFRGIDDKRYQYSYVRLDGVKEFAKVKRVTQFTHQSGTRPFDLRSQYDLTSRLPRAVLAVWDTIEAGPFVPSRQELRDRFVSAIESGSDCDLPPNLHLHITVEAPNFRHNQSLPNFTAPHTTYDRVSSALRQLSERAVKFEFSGIADHTLLWPSPSQVEIQEPYWAGLTCLEIKLSLQSPSGKWYFRGKEDSNRPGDVPIPDGAEAFFPPGYYEDDDVEYIDYNQEAADFAEALEGSSSGSDDGIHANQDFRDWPDDEELAPLLAAYAKAIGAMPSLKSANLQFDISRIQFYLYYTSPGLLAVDKEYLSEEERPLMTDPRLLAHTRGWRMDGDVEDLFRKAGARIHGVETALRYLPDIYATPER